VTPNDDPKPEGPSNPKSGDAWLPPRLRDKLGDGGAGGGGGDDDFDFLKKKSSPVGMIVTIVVGVALVGGIWWMVHNSQEKAKVAAAKAAEATRQAAIADSLAEQARVDSIAAKAHADSVAFAALPKSEQRRILAARAKNQAAASGGSTASAPATSAPATSAPATGAATGGGTAPAAGGTAAGGTAAGGAAAAEPAPPKEKGPYAIDAGQFLDQTQATTTADALKGTTGLAAQVITDGEGDAATYHVLLGSYASRAAAEAKASALLSKSLVQQAAVVPIPKK